MGVALKPAYPVKSLGRVDVDVRGFMEALNDKGYLVTWEQRALCSCVEDTDDHQPLVDCPVCAGRGEYWHTPQDAKCIMTRFEYSEMAKHIGEFMPGTVLATFAPEQLPGIRDRFTLQNSVLSFGEVLARTAGSVQTHGRANGGTRYPIVSRTLRLDVEGTPATRTINVLHLRKNGASGYPTTELTEGTDFDITSGSLDWTKGDALGTAPAVGVGFTISYFAHPRYMILDFAHAIRDSFVKFKAATSTFTPLPLNMMARLDFYLE